MYYSQDDDVKFEVGDIVTHSNTYDRSPVIEIVTFVGCEGVVLQPLGGNVTDSKKLLTESKRFAALCQSAFDQLNNDKGGDL